MDWRRLSSKVRPSDATKSQWLNVQRKAQEILRMCNLRFDSAAFGIGEVAKGVLCLDLASSIEGMKVERQHAVRASGLSDKAYGNMLASLRNALGIRMSLDVRELAIQFGCVRIAESAKRNLSEYTQRFKNSIAEGRRDTADFSQPVFAAASFYLTARRHKLKVDRGKLLEVTQTPAQEFQRVAASMQELCPFLFGSRKQTLPSEGVGPVVTPARDACASVGTGATEVAERGSLEADRPGHPDEFAVSPNPNGVQQADGEAAETEHARGSGHGLKRPREGEMGELGTPPSPPHTEQERQQVPASRWKQSKLRFR